MVLSKRVGAILREAREARKLSIKDVARETNITPRYIEALENEDYSQFPGETYALGFLRNYSDFLALDTEHLVNLYRGHQIDLSEAPLKELTRSTSVLPASLTSVDPRIWYGVAGAGVLLLIIFSFASGAISLPSFGGGGDDEAAFCDREDVTAITLPQAGAPTREEQLSLGNAVSFSAGSARVRLCLDRVERSGTLPTAYFRARINEEINYSFQAAQGETVTLDAAIDELSAMDLPVQITAAVLGDVSARVGLGSGDGLAGGPGETPGVGPGVGVPAEGVVPGEQKPPLSAGDIQVTLVFTAPSFISWVEDGNSHRGREVAAGERRTLEARNRLEIKIGNGGGVNVIYGNQPPRVAGPPGKIVNIVYRKAPDPLDPGASRIEESIEVQR
jgi:transcriptional regulator with XRE-family HTH domain